MDRLETISLSSHLSISPYRRYVDDIYLQTTSNEMADQFHHTMNNLHPKLKLEIKKSKGLSLSLSKKPAEEPLSVHNQSATPKKSKITFIRNERKRTAITTTTKHQNMFDDILPLNGTPRAIRKTLNLSIHNGHISRFLHL